ncbi:MAG: nitrogen fixation protein NifH [Alphaproteobacteria bacterium]|nr:nitrogen fixation protein NifH [Alphaproteobacteria bacterium]
MDAATRIAPETLEWLLDPSDPSVRYFTLRDLLQRRDDDAELRAARAGIMAGATVSAILAGQHEDGYWVAPNQFYTAKYRGTVWQLITLAELGADGRDPRIQKACAYLLDISQDRQSGGFSAEGCLRNGGQHSSVIPCLSGNMVFALLRLGCRDERMQAGIDWITNHQRFDDGDVDAPKGWPYDRYQMCWGRHTCHMGVVKAMKGLAEIPETERSEAVRTCLANAAEFMLIHHIHKRSHDLDRTSKPGWKKFGFPRMYQTDALEILNLLLDLGHRDPRMAEAVALVASRQGADGHWRLADSFNRSMDVPIEKLGQPSKWITLKALTALGRWQEAA